MSAPPRRRPRPPFPGLPLSRRPAALLLAVALAGGALLTGCGAGQVGGQASTASTSAAATSAGASPAGASAASLTVTADLSAGLLPADAFPAGATVTPLTGQQLQQRGQLVGGSLGGLTVTPETCTAAVQRTQTGLDGVEGVAAQTARLGRDLTVEVIASGPAVDGAAGALADGVAGCPQATVTSPQHGTAEIAFHAVEGPDLGDGSTVVAVTTSVTTNGQTVPVPALIGVVQDGDRVVTLISTSPAAPADPAPFLALLEQAYEHQADALD
jgi:hypothetical protein